MIEEYIKKRRKERERVLLNRNTARSMASSCTLSAKSITVKEVIDERFEDIYRPSEDTMQLLDNGRSCTTVKPRSFGCTLGHKVYSSGIHRIRLRLDVGIAFFGIRSRQIPPVPDEFAWGRYDNSPSTYGWSTNGGRICNGRDSVHGEQKHQERPVGFVLTLNCDEHRLSMINENSNDRDELEVDLLHAPFPWCLFVQLWRGRSRVSLVNPPSLTFKLTPSKAPSSDTTIEPSGNVVPTIR